MEVAVSDPCEALATASSTTRLSDAGVPPPSIADMPGPKDTRMASLYDRDPVRPTISTGNVSAGLLHSAHH